MGIELKISGDNAEMFKANLYQTFRALLPSLAGMEPPRASQGEPVVDETVVEVQAEAPVETKVEEPKAETKTTRKPRAAKADPAPETEKPADTETTEVVEPPIEDIRAALQSLAKSKGDDAVWTLLNKHKCKGATAVKDAGKGAVVVADCKALEAA